MKCAETNILILKFISCDNLDACSFVYIKQNFILCV